MAGYNGFSKSNNAINAEKNNVFPLTVAIKELATQAKITQKQAKAVLLEIGETEWHHTSKFYTRTPYYCVFSAMAFVKENGVPEILNSAFKKSEITADIEYLEWGGSRKHPTARKVEIKNAKIERISEKFCLINGDIKKGLDTKGFKINGFYPNLYFQNAEIS